MWVELALTLLREVGGMAPCGAPRELLILSKPLEKLPSTLGAGGGEGVFLESEATLEQAALAPEDLLGNPNEALQP